MDQHPQQLALPLIDWRRCTGCGLCEQLCPTKAVEVRDHRAVIVRPQDCSFCDVCESYCPAGAIGRPFTIVFATSARCDAEALPEEK
jgi:formate hydrogenlyase subunit 6/NADH:ubiquinone oxidoreductase subunit I